MVRYWWIGNAECVGNRNDTNSTETCDKDLHQIIPILALIFDILSISGALFIIITYYAYRDLRTRARLILLMISLADLINAISYGVAFIYNIFTPYYATCYPDKSKFEISVCVIQATLSNFSNNASIIWTAILGVQITLLFFRSRTTLMNTKIFVVTTVLAWCIPLLVSVLGLLLNIFGPGKQNVNVGWCFVSSYSNLGNDTIDDGHIFLQLAMAKLWEVIIFCVLVVTYSASLLKVCRHRKVQKGNWGIASPHDLRLIWIPVIFFSLRIWGNIRWVMNLFLSQDNSAVYCVIDRVLAALQAIGDPGQGWANAVFYIFLNEALRQRTWTNFKIYFCCWIKRRRQTFFSEKSYLVPNRKSETVM